MEQVAEITREIEAKLIAYRRDFHKYAESDWTEFRTASLIAGRLVDLGLDIRVGRQVISSDHRMGLPSKEEFDEHYARAVGQGGDKRFIEAVKDGFTGVVGIIENGPGPVVALRFDIDALGVAESSDESHRPAREGFASVNDNVMHACGHDCHAAAGLGVAEVLSRLKSSLKGTVKLLFQPAEEGVRGAKSMVESGILDDVKYLIGHHVMNGWAVGELICGMGGYAATSKLDATISGESAHAGGSPHLGNNALLAAATAVLNLHSISRHSEGSTRINVGRLTAGTGRNVIPDFAKLVVETRGATSELNAYMYENAVRILHAATQMYGCSVSIAEMGGAESGESDDVLANRVQTVAERMGGFEFFEMRKSGGSEDLTYMMKRVQQNGGIATNIGVGADFHGISRDQQEGREAILRAHTPQFDVDERAIGIAVGLLSNIVLDICV